MKSKKMKAFLIATVFAFESIVMGFVPVNAQPVSVSENDMVNQDVEEKTVAEYAVSSDETKKAAEKSEDINAEAATVVYSGIDGDLSWSIDTDGHLTISGNGDYEERDYFSTTGWLAHKNEIKSATVNVSGIANASYMFSECENMTSIDLTNFDTSSVTDMECMFNCCKSLTNLDVRGFKTSSVTDMRWMFRECNGLTSLDVSGFNTSGVTDMLAMFYGCQRLTSLDVSRFDTSNVTKMNSMFACCFGLTSLDVSGFDTSNVTEMQTMFWACDELTSLDVSGFDTSRVTGMKGMFAHCRKLISLDISGFDMSNVTDVNDMFDDCNNLTQIIAPQNKSSEIMELPTTGTYTWKYRPTGVTVTTITKAGTYVRCDVYAPVVNNNNTGAVLDTKPALAGTTINSSNLAGTGIPTNATFTVTSSDPSNPTVAFNGVSDENAAAVTIPSTITYNGVTYKVTSVAVTDFSKTKENAQFKVTGNQVGDLTVEYTAPANKKKTSVTIPEYTTYKGIKFKVTSVAAKAFKNNKKVKKITVPASITKIGKESFRNCKNLKKITIKSKNLKSIGKNAFKGINKKCKIKVPKSKLKAYKKLFKKKGQAKTVKITK